MSCAAVVVSYDDFKREFPEVNWKLIGLAKETLKAGDLEVPVLTGTYNPDNDDTGAGYLVVDDPEVFLPEAYEDLYGRRYALGQPIYLSRLLATLEDDRLKYVNVQDATEASKWTYPQKVQILKQYGGNVFETIDRMTAAYTKEPQAHKFYRHWLAERWARDNSVNIAD